MMYQIVPEELLIASSVAVLKPWFECEIKDYAYNLIEVGGIVYFEANDDEMLSIFLSIPHKYLR